MPKISTLVLEACRAQPRAFAPMDIRGYLDSRYPQYSPAISAETLSGAIHYLRTKETLAIVKRGTNGGPHTYRYVEAKK